MQGDHLGSGFLQGLTDWMFLDRIEDKCDVIAIDYYAANLPRAIKNGKQWGIFPEPAGIYRALKTLKARYPNKPLLIAEAGMPTEDGEPRDDGVTREDLLRDSVYWVQRAHEDGINVIVVQIPVRVPRPHGAPQPRDAGDGCRCLRA